MVLLAAPLDRLIRSSASDGDGYERSTGKHRSAPRQHLPAPLNLWLTYGCAAPIARLPFDGIVLNSMQLSSIVGAHCSFYPLGKEVDMKGRRRPGAINALSLKHFRLAWIGRQSRHREQECSILSANQASDPLLQFLTQFAYVRT